MNETPEATPTAKTPDYYRVHTYEKRGPSARERKNYLHSISIVLPHPQGEQPLGADQIAKFFVEQRMARFPDQAKQAMELARKKVMARHNREKAGRAKR
jgi:hypothetical protein